jgi:hypothetical protein
VSPEELHEQVITDTYRVSPSMNIELSSVALKLLNDLYRTGLYGATIEEVARRLVEDGLRQRIADGTIKPT